MVIAQIRRGDANILPRPDLLLEFGDRVGMLAHRDDFPALQKFFGDSIKGTAEFSYISIGLGMALGFLLGAIQFPLPGIGKLSVGLAGVLIMALILGNMRRSGGMNWTIPLSANLVLRNLGLTLFLAQVGMASGPKFAATVTQSGLQMLFLGAIVLAALVLPILILGPGGVPDALRRGGGHRLGRLRQSGDPGLFEQGHADGSARPRLRDDLSGDDDREDPLRGHRAGAVPMTGTEGAIMKKTLLASILISCGTGAIAQSSVTIFGIIDTNLQYANQNDVDATRLMGNGGLQASRIGFRGIEDLGGGLSAGFHLEGE